MSLSSSHSNLENEYTCFFISDGTGFTTEVLGHSLLSRFKRLSFNKVTIPYVNTIDDAQSVVRRIKAMDQSKVVVLMSIVSLDVRAIVKTTQALVLDMFDTFLSPLETLFGMQSDVLKASHKDKTESQNYLQRIEAMNFALENDDGGNINKYHEADVIIVGLSRSGKTPTCLYLSMNFGILAANYPITEDDFERGGFPLSLVENKRKIVGLMIDTERLNSIREERFGGSRYASIQQCDFECRELEKMYRRYNVPFLNSTALSIEELATRIMMQLGIERRLLK